MSRDLSQISQAHSSGAAAGRSHAHTAPAEGRRQRSSPTCSAPSGRAAQPRRHGPLPPPGPPGALSPHPAASPKNLRRGGPPSSPSPAEGRLQATRAAGQRFPPPSAPQRLTCRPFQWPGRRSRAHAPGGRREAGGGAPPPALTQATPSARRPHPLTHRPNPRGGAALKASAHAPARFPWQPGGQGYVGEGPAVCG